jgi:opacity protein-like surface antigen
VAGQTYEARVRKPDGKGFEITSLYRHGFSEDLFVHGGLRLGLYKINYRDTGSRITYSAPATPSAIVTIQDDREKKTVSFGLMAGIGYRLTEKFSLEANVFTVRLGDPVGYTSTSLASELCFGIRF